MLKIHGQFFYINQHCYKTIKQNQRKPGIRGCTSLELDEWLTKEEMMMKQKSKELWLKNGDMNTRFFHLSTLKRRRKNRITEIKLDNGQWINDTEDIQLYFKEKFRSLYQSSNPQFPNNLEGLIQACVSEEENSKLCEVPFVEEIKRTVFSINSWKAPGPNRLSELFYKHYWDIVGN